MMELTYTPKILVVDDEVRIGSACKAVLEEEGFHVAVATDGNLGLKAISDEHFDIVLLDLMMPSLSGFEVLSRIRSLHPDTVVIVITGYATIEHSIEAMKKGAFDFIPKPFTPDQLRVVVGKALKYNRALQDIADAQSRLRVMVNRLSDGVMTTDRQKKIVLANPAFLHMIGYHEKSAIGQNIADIVSCDALLWLIDQTLSMPPEKFSEITRELPIAETDGRVLSASCSPFRDRMGMTIGTITVLHDITALKEMDRMKSEFVSMVSHEIRSPMNSVLMQLKVVVDGLAGNVTEKQAEILNRASEKIRNLTDMTSELLDLSRIESGLITHEKENLELDAVLKEQVNFHTPVAKDKDIQIQLDIREKLLPILANRYNMEEVLANLINNAIKYSPPGGIIELSAETENGYMILRISDTGYGIPEEERERIFDRFYRIKNEKTRYVQGTGLGLCLVKSIVQAHHGQVRVEGRTGGGSTFVVRLPLADS